MNARPASVSISYMSAMVGHLWMNALPDIKAALSTDKHCTADWESLKSTLATGWPSGPEAHVVLPILMDGKPTDFTAKIYWDASSRSGAGYKKVDLLRAS